MPKKGRWGIVWEPQRPLFITSGCWAPAGAHIPFLDCHVMGTMFLLLSLMFSQEVDNQYQWRCDYTKMGKMGFPIKLNILLFKPCDWATYIILFLCCGGAVGAKEVLPVEVFGCNVSRSLLSDSLVFLRSPPVLLQIQPACQMDAERKHTCSEQPCYLCINFRALYTSCKQYTFCPFSYGLHFILIWIWCTCACQALCNVVNILY